ncbi:DegT/DnrJ/EryC1/StrS family aminotransferase [Delftia acidovorans]
MIPVYQPYLTGQEKNYVNQCLDSTWISSKGEFISRFENEFAKYIGVKKATSVNNGTVAIHLALEALGLNVGDEVIVPALTYIASVNTIIQTGATPVYVDSLPGSWQVDPADIARKINERTRAVMVVHLYGLPCDMDPIVELCKKHNLLLIEDCAEAFGSFYKDQHVGTFGDIATFSFFGNKTITTGEGGMVVSNNSELIDRAFHLKNQGVSKEREYWHDIVAYNYRMTNICAAIGLAQLEKADEILYKKRQIASWYESGLAGLPVSFHSEMKNTRHSFWMCSIAVNNSGDRNPLREYLRQEGIETRPVFHLVNAMPHCHTSDIFPIAEAISASGINLPSYPALSENEVVFICNKISDFFSGDL